MPPNKAYSNLQRMPVLFVGHGSPMNALEQSRWSEGFARLAAAVPRPEAILAISAHWYAEGTWLTAGDAPRTIHDFYGFPKPLYEIEYRAPGQANLAARVRDRIGSSRAALSSEWGLDHGTWSVLKWMYPDASVPVVQLSIDRGLDARAHYELARHLVELRSEGVLIVGSGNVVHNLRDAVARMHSRSPETPPWASAFDREVKSILAQHDHQALSELWPGSRHALEAHPTPDHFLPLLYSAAVTDSGDAVSFPTEGFDLGSISMRNVLWS